MYTFLTDWPPYSQDPDDIDKLDPTLPLSLDLEWDQIGSPTILGLSDGKLHISCDFYYGLPYFKELLAKHPNIELTGHNLIGADIFVLEKMGMSISLENVTDTILLHYLVNPNLCKSSGKAALEEDSGDIRGRGFMNLGSFASLYTDLPHWKTCRGATCDGPCPEHAKFYYNAMDSASVAMALPKVKRQARLRGVDRLYDIHRDLSWVLANMQDYGLKIDEPYVDELNETFLKEKAAIEESFPFNPKSPKAVMEHFKEYSLRDAQESTVRELIEELEDGAPDDLVALLDYKELGNGTERWFQRQYRDSRGWLQGYMDPNGFVHPRLNFFTSSGRLACSSPNLQNVSKRRVSRKICVCGSGRDAHPTLTCGKFKGESVGKKVRRAIIAPPGWYITRADLSNAENRYVLHRAGYDIPRDIDLHEWVKNIAGFTDDMEISVKYGSARDAAKRIQHANNILEGLQLKDRGALQSPKCRAEIAAGARLVYSDWTFAGKIVSFSGVNLAKQDFGSASYENRKKALDISRQYFERFPGVRTFQREVSRQVETEHCVRTPFGYVLPMYGGPEDRMKIAQGVQQQNPIAHVTKLALLRCWERWKRDGLQRPVLQIHDEILCYTKDSVDPKVAMAWLQEDMEISLTEVGGLVIPAEPSHGPSWAEQYKE